MTQNNKNQEKDALNKGNRGDFDKDQPSEVAGQPIHDRNKADDKGQGLSYRPYSDSAVIPEADGSDAEGARNENEKHTEATMPPGQGTDPKRNTM